MVLSALEILVKLLGFLAPPARRWWRGRQSRKRQRSMAAIRDVYATLQSMKRAAGACRALILRTENGGGRPQPGTPLFSTAVHEVYALGLDSAAEHWQRREVDAHYMGLLVQVMDQRRVTVCTDDIPERSQLRPIYSAAGIEESVVFLIGTTDTSVCYGSLNFHKDRTAVAEDEKRIAIDDGIAKLRTLFRDFGGWLVEE